MRLPWALLLVPVCSQTFNSIWYTSYTNEPIVLPLSVSPSVLDISWGDGTSTISTPFSPVSHPYASVGNHTIKITGVIRGWSFNGTGDCDKILSIEDWGQFTIDANSSSMFKNCSNLTVSNEANQPVFDGPGASTRAMFHGCKKFNTSLTWDILNVTEAGYMFAETLNYDSPLTLLNSHNLLSMDSMFFAAEKFNRPLSFDTAGVSNMQSCFFRARLMNSPISFNTSRVLYMPHMFGATDEFNQVLYFDTRSVTNFGHMFDGARKYNQPINFDTRSAVSMYYMFSGSAIDSPITFSDTSLVDDMNAMFASTPFSHPVNFNTKNVGYFGGMFRQAPRFNQPLHFNTQSAKEMFWMFRDASAFNNVLNFSDTSKVYDMSAMFQNATLFNQPLKLDTRSVTNFDSFLEDASSFNQPLDFDTRSAQSMVRMFAGARVFNQSLIWNTSQCQDMSHMFRDTDFDSPLTFDTRKVQSMASMFEQAGHFNRPVAFNTSSVVDFKFMFFNSKKFNYPVVFDTRQVGTAKNGSVNFMFSFANSFNQPINFDLRFVTQADFMFQEASMFNSPVNIMFGSNVSCIYMFANALSFNQPIDFGSTIITFMRGMFQGASSFNSAVKLNTRLVSDMSNVFYNAESFNQPLDFDTSKVVQMVSMFEGANSLRQTTSQWNISGVIACQNFCSRCGLPSFTCDVSCSTTKRTSLEGWQVCSCPIGQKSGPNMTCDGIACLGRGITGQAGFCECATGFTGKVAYHGTNVTGCAVQCVALRYMGNPDNCTCGNGFAGTAILINDTYTGCEENKIATELCKLIQLGASLHGECVQNNSSNTSGAPNPTLANNNGIIISPIVNITRIANSSLPAGGFIFTLPVNTQVMRQTTSQNCFGSKVRCEWQNPVTLEFQSSGCTVSEENVALNTTRMIVGVQCTCSHLTVFAIILRQELQQEALCQAEVQDYVLIGLYAAVMAVALAQLTRLVISKAYEISFVHHSTILVAAALRVAYLVAKPVMSSLAGLVFLGLLPSALGLSVFVHLLLTWASLRLFTMTTSPFAKFRKPLVAVIVCVMLLTIALSTAVALAASVEMQQEVVVNGSYILAAMYALICVMIVWSGLSLTSLLANSSSGSRNVGTNKTMSVRTRVLISSLGLGFCLLFGACLWVAAVREEILDSVSATLSISIAFYVFDWLSLCMLLGLFAPGVKRAAESSDHRVPQRLIGNNVN